MMKLLAVALVALLLAGCGLHPDIIRQSWGGYFLFPGPLADAPRLPDLGGVLDGLRLVVFLLLIALLLPVAIPAAVPLIGGIVGAVIASKRKKSVWKGIFVGLGLSFLLLAWFVLFLPIDPLIDSASDATGWGFFTLWVWIGGSWVLITLWVWIGGRMVIDCLKSNHTTGGKVAWICVGVCLPIVGPVLYYFFGRNAQGGGDANREEGNSTAYVGKDGQQYGPYTVEQLREYVQQGNFTSADHACYDGQNWVTIAQVPGFAEATQPAATPSPTTPQQDQAVQEHAVEQQPASANASNSPAKKRKIILWTCIVGGAKLLVASLWIWILFGDEEVKKDGLETGRYGNGQKRCEYIWKDGNLVTATVWKPNGEKCPYTNLVNGTGIICEYTTLTAQGYSGKRSEETFKDGKKHGLETSWLANGQLLMEGTWVDGKRHGLWTYWHGNRQKHYEATYKDGELDGLATTWYRTTRPDGTRTGPWSVFGNKKSEKIYKDGEVIFQKHWDKDGNPLGKDQRVAVQKYKNGQKRWEYTWRDGKMHGLRTRWYENGQKEEEYTYKGGLEDGLRTFWYENGQKHSEHTYKDGLEDGLRTFWYENGEKHSEHTYKDGLEDDLRTFWYENGEKQAERTFKDGRLIADKRWDRDGKPLGQIWWHDHGWRKKTERTFKDGKLIAEKRWIRDGKPLGQTWWYDDGLQKKEERTYKNGKFIAKKRWDRDGKPLGQDQGAKAPPVVAKAPKVVVDRNQLKRRDGLGYFEGKPFTGVAVKKYPNGQKSWEATFKNGKLHGLQTLWYSNGQKKFEHTFKAGKKVGLQTDWYKNGQKMKETTYKDGKVIPGKPWARVISTKEWDADGNRTR